MAIANIWDSTASGGAGAWVPAIIGPQGYQGSQGFQGYQGNQGYQGYISPLTTQGDIFAYSTSGTRLPTGNEGESLSVIPSSGIGVSYFPAQVNIQKVTIGGHSYTDNTSGYTDQTVSGPGTDGKYVNSTQSTTNHILSALGFDPTRLRYLGFPGTVLQFDLATSSGVFNGMGGWVSILRNVVPTRARYPYTSDNGLCIGLWGINDMGFGGYSSTVYLPAFKDALRTVISRFRASTVSGYQSFVYVGGTVESVNSTTINTDNGYLTLSSGSTVVATVPLDFEGQSAWDNPSSGGVVGINFIGGGPSGTGGTVSIQVDSSAVGFTINGVATSNFTVSGYGQSMTPRVGQVARIGGLSAGGHTISITVTSTNTPGGTVDLDSYQIESSSPNPIIIANIANVFGSNSSYSNVVNWNTAINSVVSEFPKPIAVANIQDLLYVPTSGINKLSPNDLIHPSELGGIYIAEEIRKSYTRMSVPLRGFVSSATDYAMVGLPSFPMANLRRSRQIVDNGGFKWGNTQSMTIGQTGVATAGSISATNVASVTTASSTGSSVVFTANNTFQVGTMLGVTGLTGASSGSFNTNSALVTTTSPTQFTATFTNMPPSSNVSSGTGTATGQATLNSTYVELSNLVCYYIPILIPEPCSITKFTLVSTTGAPSNPTSTIGFGLYYDWQGLPNALLYDAGTTPATTTGNKVVDVSSSPVTISYPGLYWLAIYTYGLTMSNALRVGAVYGNDPRIANLDSEGAPDGTCYIQSAQTWGNTLPATAAPWYTYVTGTDYGNSYQTLNWAPQAFITVQGNY